MPGHLTYLRLPAKGCLDDDALALVDGDWASLDVSGSSVSHAGLLLALGQLPRLRALDVSRRAIRALLLSSQLSA